MLPFLIEPLWLPTLSLLLILIGTGVAISAERGWAAALPGRRPPGATRQWRSPVSAALLLGAIVAAATTLVLAPANSTSLMVLLLSMIHAALLGPRWMMLTGAGALSILLFTTLELDRITRLLWLVSFGVQWSGVTLLRALADSAREAAALHATDSTRHREALRKAELRFQLMVERMPAIFYVAAPDAMSSTIYTSPQIETILGFRQDEWIADPAGWLAQIHPDDRARVLADVERAQTSGEPITSEYRMLTRAGAVRWFRDESVLVRDDAGRPRHVQGVMVDITERKRAEDALRESEERYRLITERSTDLIMLTNAADELVYVSPSAQTILGRAPRDLLGAALAALVHPADPWPCERADTAGAQALIRLRHASGSWRWVELACAQITSGGAALTVTVARDITERRSLESQLRQAQKLESVGRLAGGVAHEFNNLLMAIAALADMGRRSLPDVLQADLVQIIGLTSRAERLIRQLLAFARKQVMEPRVLAVNSLILDMEVLLRRLIGEHIALRTQAPAELGWVRADPAQLEQVIINLAINARDAMPEGGALTIAMAILAGDDRPGSVRLTVRDTGAGMSEDVRSHLFEPFFTTKQPGEGTGLGLSTCYGIIEQHGGHITVVSEPGRGTTFTIDLPRLLEAGAAQPEPPTGTAGQMPHGSESILLVEDEEVVREVVAWQLRDLGYTVLEAAEPVAALTLEQALQQPIHLLLTDMVMPHMSGARLAATLHIRRPALRVLFMSGYTGLAEQHTGDEALVLRKPFNQARLAETVRAALDARPLRP